MKKLLAALGFWLLPTLAFAQCTGVFPGNTVCGNFGTTPAPPHAISNVTSVYGPTSSTSGDVVTWQGTTGNILGDPGYPPVLAGGTITTSGGLSTAIDQAATGQTNQFVLGNSGTLSNAATISQLQLNLSGSGCTSCYTYLDASGGTNPSGVLSTGNGLTGGLQISAGAGNLTLVQPQFTFATGGVSSSILATSTNNLGANNFEVDNGGTLSSSPTVAKFTANLTAGATSAYIVTQVAGAASPTASISTGAGVTGGFTISAGAGALSIDNPTIITSAIGPDGGTWTTSGFNGSVIGASLPEAGTFTTVRTSGYTIAALPACTASTYGTRAYVTNGATPIVFNAALSAVASGSVVISVFCGSAPTSATSPTWTYH